MTSKTLTKLKSVKPSNLCNVMFTRNNQTKSIKWKHAFLIVILLHGAGYLGIAQYSKYKTHKAAELKKARENLYANNETKSIEWPKNENVKPVVVSVPKELFKKKEEIKLKESTVSNFIKKFEGFFNKKIEIKMPIQFVESKPISRPTPKPKPVYASSVKLKPIPTPTTPIEYVKKQKEVIVNAKPTPIPVKRALPVEPERKVVKSTTRHYSKPQSTFSDMDWGTTETVEVIESYIVLQ